MPKDWNITQREWLAKLAISILDALSRSRTRAGLLQPPLDRKGRLPGPDGKMLWKKKSLENIRKWDKRPDKHLRALLDVTEEVIELLDDPVALSFASVQVKAWLSQLNYDCESIREAVASPKRPSAKLVLLRSLVHNKLLPHLVTIGDVVQGWIAGLPQIVVVEETCGTRGQTCLKITVDGREETLTKREGEGLLALAQYGQARRFPLRSMASLKGKLGEKIAAYIPGKRRVGMVETYDAPDLMGLVSDGRPEGGRSVTAWQPPDKNK